jgi:hypothetical protein
VTIVTFPGRKDAKNKTEVRKTYTSAFNAKSLSGKMSIINQMELGDYYFQEQSLGGFNDEPVVNYLLFKFKDDKIIEIIYLPKNWCYKQ